MKEVETKRTEEGKVRICMVTATGPTGWGGEMLVDKGTRVCDVNGFGGRKGSIVNGAKADPSYVLREGDIVE